MDENGAWKPMGEDWAQQQQHRSGFTHDEEFRGVGDGFGPGQSMPMEQMMQQRMGDFDGMRRVDPRALQNGPGGGGAVFYNGANSQPYPGGPGGAGVKDEMVRRPPFADMVRPGQEGGAQGLGSMHGSPNLANSLLNTNLGNYLTAEARAVSAQHRHVLVKVVCNYRRTDDLNPGGRASPPEAANNRCKTILAFQEGNGTHLCFGMFVKEYIDLEQVYIDSVDSTPLLEGENGEDRQKTMTSIVLAYMNHAKMRGFKRLYLRVAPPTDENSFIFTRRLPNEDHHAEEAYRAMTASLVQTQQGAKDLVEVANRLQDRFFCVLLQNPSVKAKEIEDDGIIVESEAMRDRASFAEVCLRQHLLFNVAEASAKSSTVLIALISKEQQDSANNAGGQQQMMMMGMNPMHHQVDVSGNMSNSGASMGAGAGEEARQRAGMMSRYSEGEQDMMNQGTAGHNGSRGGPGAIRDGRGRGVPVGSKEARTMTSIPMGNKRHPSEMEMYKDMEGAGAHGRGMGSMQSGMMPHGSGIYPADAAAFYGYPSHMDNMMNNGYMPSHRMPYGGMHGGFPADMYGGSMDELKDAHAKHASIPNTHGMGMHPDARWQGGSDPRMSGRGMWQHPSARDAMRGMGMSGRFGRGEGIDPRMMEAHGFSGYDPSYADHVGNAPHMTSSPLEIHAMMPPRAGSGSGAHGWGVGMPSGGMPRKAQGSGGTMVPGRTGSSQGSAPAGRAVNNKKRGNVASGVNVNLPGQPMMPGFGGGGDESAVNMFTDGMQGQDQFEQRDADRKRSMAEMSGVERQEEILQEKRKKLDDEAKHKIVSKCVNSGVSSPHMPEIKDGAGVCDADVDTQAMMQPGIAGDPAEDRFLEADSFLSAPEPGAQ